MKKTIYALLLAGAMSGAACGTAEPASEEAPKNDCFRPGEVWLDDNGTAINAHGGGFLFHDGTYYWFGEHKIEGSAGNVAHVGVRCYSSKDLYNWHDEGVALAVSDAPESPIAAGCVLERPKVIYNARTGKFVMWFHLERLGLAYKDAMIGIAQADAVTGPYAFVRCTRGDAGTWPVNVEPFHKLPVAEPYRAERSNLLPTEHPDSVNSLGQAFERGQHSRDMTLFVDDDGKAYHIRSSESNSTLHISQLTDDYLDFSGRWVRALVGHRLEAPALFKHNGLYYLMGSGCTGWNPNPGRSAVAPSIWGPWTEIGNPCVDEEAETTYRSQSTYILPVEGRDDCFIYVGDRWNAQNAIDGRYVWLPVEFEGDRFILHWLPEWRLEVFDK